MDKNFIIIIYLVLLSIIIGLILYFQKIKFDIKYQYAMVAILLVIIISLYIWENNKGGGKGSKCITNQDCTSGYNCVDGACKKIPDSVCSSYNANISQLTCTPLSTDKALKSSQIKKDHLYLEYYAREPTTRDHASGGNYLKWIYNQVQAMGSEDILLMQTDFFNFDDSFDTALKGAASRGAFIYLIIDRWQDWGCPFPNNWDESKVSGGNCGSGGTINTYQGKLPANNNCKWVDGIIQQFRDVKNFIIVDLAGGCGGTGAGSCKSPGCPDYTNKPNITTQKDDYIPGASARGNPVHAHRKIISFYSKKRNIGSIYKGSMNIQTQQTGTEGVREVGWGITGLLNDPFMKGHVQHDLNCINWFFPGGKIPDYGYKIIPNQTQDNQDNADLAKKLENLGPQYPVKGFVVVTLNWSTPDFRNIDTTSPNEINWISGVDINVKVWLGLNPPGKKQVIPIGTFNSDVDIFGNIKNKNKNNLSWSAYQKEMTDRTETLMWDKSNDQSPSFAEGSVWGGSLIVKMLKNAIAKKSKFVKIHMYNYFWSSFRPCSDRTGVDWGSGDDMQIGYSLTGVPGKGIDKGKTVASLVDPLPPCQSSIGVDSDSWHNNLQPEFVRALYDYMDSDVGKCFIVSGIPMMNKDSCCMSSWCGGGTPDTNHCINTKKQCSSNSDCMGPPTDLKSYILLQLNKAGPQYDTGASKNQWWRWYSLNQKASCDAEHPTDTSFCKSHEKLWFTDSDVLIASGHPDRGYYADFNSICDDILFEDAYSFVDAYNNMYNRIWGHHSVGPIFTGGKTGSGPTNPNWGTWKGDNINNLSWKPTKSNDAMYPMGDSGCAACFGSIDSDGYCNNTNSTSHSQYCLYNIN